MPHRPHVTVHILYISITINSHVSISLQLEMTAKITNNDTIEKEIYLLQFTLCILRWNTP